MTYISMEQAMSKGHGTWRSFTCPSHEDANPSARVNMETGRWMCFVCHASGDTKGYVPDYDLILENSIEAMDYVDMEKPESWLDQFDSGPVHEYWLSRFSEEVCRIYRLGWDGIKEKPCYPIRAVNGKPLGVVHRSLDPGERKYKYPLGVTTSRLLFGLHELRQTDVLFLLEGAPAAIAVREAGHDAISSYGSELHPEQVRIIASLHPRIVYIAYDMDTAGHEGAGPAEAALGRAGVLAERIFWDARYSDPGDMDLETRSNTLAKALAPSRNVY